MSRRDAIYVFIVAAASVVSVFAAGYAIAAHLYDRIMGVP